MTAPGTTVADLLRRDLAPLQGLYLDPETMDEVVRKVGALLPRLALASLVEGAGLAPADLEIPTTLTPALVRDAMAHAAGVGPEVMRSNVLARQKRAGGRIAFTFACCRHSNAWWSGPVNRDGADAVAARVRRYLNDRGFFPEVAIGRQAMGDAYACSLSVAWDPAERRAGAA